MVSQRVVTEDLHNGNIYRLNSGLTSLHLSFVDKDTVMTAEASTSSATTSSSSTSPFSAVDNGAYTAGEISLNAEVDGSKNQ